MVLNQRKRKGREGRKKTDEKRENMRGRERERESERGREEEKQMGDFGVKQRDFTWWSLQAPDVT